MIDFTPLSLATILVLVDLIIRVLAVIYVPRNRRPQTALAWLLAIFFIPYLGILLYLLVGNSKLPKGRRRKQEEINQYILDGTEGMEDVIEDPPWPAWLHPIVELNRNLGAMPLVGGNRAKLLPDYEESLAAMTDAVDAASRTVHVEFYILVLDDTTAPFFDALERAVQRGVVVRVLIDHLASIRTVGHRKTATKLAKIGVYWHYMLPVRPWRGQWQRPDLRNHRKLVVVDRSVGFTGSQNFIDSSYNKRRNIKRGLHWKDLMVRFEGPIVAGIEALFATDWYCETNELLLREAPVAREARVNPIDAQVVPSGPGFAGENNLRLFNSLVYAATKQIIITSPYFVPDSSMLVAITTAAQSGLDVQLFASEVGDQAVVYHAQRSYYEELLRAGVRIWLYKAPTVLHAKFFTIDDEVAVVGSSNMDMRSFALALEISVMVRGSSIISDLHALQDHYRSNSCELKLDEWMTRSRVSATFDNVARLAATLQ
ncbi:MAG: cardiolipin synthase [Salinibacterium sp.]|nr:cardiolipin synthase [Salinibacterium sp.]